MTETSLWDLAWTVRVAMRFMGNSMTLERLLLMTEKDVLAIPGIGKVSLEDIKISLADGGLQLKEETIREVRDSSRNKYHRNALMGYLHVEYPKKYTVTKLARVFKMSRTNVDRIVIKTINRRHWGHKIELLFVKDKE